MVAHLRRLAGWSVGSLVAGVLLALSSRDPAGAAAAWMTAGWAGVNLLICAAGFRDRMPIVLPKLREFLALNLGLNVAYIGVGTTMAILGSPGVAGAGVAVAI